MIFRLIYNKHNSFLCFFLFWNPLKYMGHMVHVLCSIKLTIERGKKGEKMRWFARSSIYNPSWRRNFFSLLRLFPIRRQLIPCP